MSNNVMFSPTLIINVSILPNPTNLQIPNINTAAFISSETPSWYGVSDYVIYPNATQVGIDFGTGSKAFAIATAFFAQNPNPVNSGGYLVICPRKVATPVTASIIIQDLTFTAVATGEAGDEITINYLDTVEAGSEVCTVVGNAITIAIDSGESTATQVQTAFNAQAAATVLATCTISGTGGHAQLAPVAATHLAGGVGAIETIVQNITRTNLEVYYFGVLVDVDLETIPTTFSLLSAYINAANLILFYASSHLGDFNGSGIFNTVQAATQQQTRCFYYSDGSINDTYGFAAAYASRLLSTNFTQPSSVITMNLKQLVGFAPDQTLTPTTLALAQAAGVDVYISIGGNSDLYTSGANGFMDSVYCSFWLKFALQTAGFNFLGLTATKIPQTEIGMTGLKNAYGQVFQQAILNGFLAPGAWNAPANFGPAGDLIRNIADVGYYIYSLPVSQQSQTDRTNRKAPAISCAGKEAGAIHSSNVQVILNP